MLYGILGDIYISARSTTWSLASGNIYFGAVLDLVECISPFYCEETGLFHVHVMVSFLT